MQIMHVLFRLRAYILTDIMSSLKESLKNAAEARAWIAAWRAKQASANGVENLAKGLKDAAIGAFAISAPLGDALTTPKALSLPKFEDTKDGLVEAKEIVVGNLTRGFKELNEGVSLTVEEMDAGIKALKQAIGSSAEQSAGRNEDAAAVMSEDDTSQVPTATESPLQYDDDKADVDEVRNWIQAWRERQQ